MDVEDKKSSNMRYENNAIGHMTERKSMRRITTDLFVGGVRHDVHPTASGSGVSMWRPEMRPGESISE